jgi:hypothetical protein
MLFNNGALLVVYTTLIDQLPRPWGFQLSVLIFGGFVYSSLALMYRLASLEKNSAMKANNGNSYKLIKKVEIEGNYFLPPHTNQKHPPTLSLSRSQTPIKNYDKFDILNTIPSNLRGTPCTIILVYFYARFGK